MYGRPTILFPLALLAFLALLTLWIDHSVQAPEPKPAGNSRHDPDYFLNNFVTSKTDVSGNLEYMLAAVSMKHYPDDDSTNLERPRFTMYGVDKPYMQIEGQRGVVSGNGETVEFMDNVKVVRQAFEGKGEMTLATEYIKIYPNKNMATTDRPVVITQAPKTVIHATGMIFDKKQQTMTLLQRVRAHYENPNPPKKAAVKKAGNKPSNSKTASNKASSKNAVDQNSVNKSNTRTKTVKANPTNSTADKRHAKPVQNEPRR